MIEKSKENMTKEAFEKLNKWEKVLHNAYHKSFIHLSASEFAEIAAIYDTLYEPLTRAQRNCNTCRLNALKKLGEDYEKYKNKPKVGRPKKIDLDGE